MSTWRRKALEYLPKHKSVIEGAESPMELWIELLLIFEDNVKSNDQDIIRKTLNYASWCCSEKSGKLPNDTSTAAYIGFYESLGGNKIFWPYFKEWFFPEEYKKLKPAFSYFANEEELTLMDSMFYEK